MFEASSTNMHGIASTKRSPTCFCPRPSHDDFTCIVSTAHTNARRHYNTTGCAEHAPFLVSGLMIRSPLTTTRWRLGRFDTKREQNASVLMRCAQKPWNVSSFSHHVCRRMSSPERPSMFADSRRSSTVSRWLLMRNANGMMRL